MLGSAWIPYSHMGPSAATLPLSEHLYNTVAYTLSSILPKTFAKANEEWKKPGPTQGASDGSLASSSRSFRALTSLVRSVFQRSNRVPSARMSAAAAAVAWAVGGAAAP